MPIGVEAWASLAPGGWTSTPGGGPREGGLVPRGVDLTLKVDLSWTRWAASVLVTSCPGGVGWACHAVRPRGCNFFDSIHLLPQGVDFFFSRGPPPGGYLLWNVEYVYVYNVAQHYNTYEFAMSMNETFLTRFHDDSSKHKMMLRSEFQVL
jgi:hypothetical protein